MSILVPEMIQSLPDTTGRLDRLISEMKLHAVNVSTGHSGYDKADFQTIKHHAEDMKAMGEYILSKLEAAIE